MPILLWCSDSGVDVSPPNEPCETGDGRELKRADGRRQVAEGREGARHRVFFSAFCALPTADRRLRCRLPSSVLEAPEAAGDRSLGDGLTRVDG